MKRKGGCWRRMMAVLLSAVLVTGMVSNAVPMTVFAQESVNGNAGETQGSVSGNSADAAEGTDSVNPKDTETAGTEEPVTADADAGSGQETPEPGTEGETEPGTVSGNDAEREPVSEPLGVMAAGAVARGG